MSEVLHRARCVQHPVREAAGLCTGCQRYYCRECVTEHKGKLRCARCLQSAGEESREVAGRWPSKFAAGLRLLGGLLACWLFFLAVGEVLMALPRASREGPEPTVEAAE